MAATRFRDASVRYPCLTLQIASGTRLGPYEIGPLIGEGGMGAVYRARDTRLDRSVAIKVLPRASADPELRARLAREARAISALSHPNICALYDVGSSDGIDYLVMELLDGETLASRLARGPLPPAQATALAIDIALALDAAHRAGLVHRDLKPGNVMLTRNGARLLDFGLAKAIENLDTNAPTSPAPLTREGVIVGTLRYMAPEQLEGHKVDSRTDIFAFGLVLYEMLAGRPAFAATSQATLVTAVLTSQPPALRGVNEHISPELERIVDRCLEKNPDDRWQSARDLAEALRWSRQPSGEVGAVARRPRRSLLPLAAIAGALGLGALATWLFVRPHQGAVAAAAPIRFSISPPAGMTFLQNPIESELAISPDGRSLAMIALDGRRQKLFVRAIDSLQPRLIAGTDDAASPFWSPDSKWIGFFAAGTLKKVPASGGPVETICPAQGNIGSWNRNGQIIFSEWGPDAAESIRLVSDSGGPIRDATDPSKGWSIWPSFLPDGRHFVFVGLFKTLPTGIYIGDIEAPNSAHLILPVRSQAEVRGDSIFYVRDSVLVRQHLDPKRLTVDGDPVPIADSVFCFAPLGSANFSLSADAGVVVWQRTPLPTQLVWRDWTGHEIARLGKPELYRHFALSADGRRIAADMFDRVTQVSNVSLFDVDRGVWTRLTSNPLGSSAPMWLRSGTALVTTYGDAKNPTRAPNLNVFQLADGSARPLREGDGVQYATAITAGDREAVYTIDRGRYREIEMVSLTGTPRISRLGSGGAWNESDAVISPDQQWLAFQSDEAGQPEIYIKPFQRTGEKVRVSSSGGSEPQWSADGRALFFLAPSRMLTKVDFAGGDHARVGQETPLFPLHSSGMMELTGLGVRHYLPAGDRILVREIPGGEDADPVVVLVNAR